MLRRYTTLPLLVLALLLAACGPAGDDRTVSTHDTAPLRLAIDRWPGYYPAVLADELGYFAEAGVAVQIELPDNTDRMLAEFAGGRYDLVGVALGDLITLTRSRPDVAVLLVSDESSGGDALLARPGLNESPGEGLRVGTNLGGFGELFVREVLPSLQIDPQQVEWVNIDASAVPEALARGELDYGHCWEPHATNAERAGARRVASSADTPGLIPDVIATTHHLAGQRGAALEAFNRGWFRAVDYWQANPAEASRRVAQRLQLVEHEVGLNGITLHDLAANRRLLGAEGVAALGAVIDRYSVFFVAHGRLLEPVRANEMLLPAQLP